MPIDWNDASEVETVVSSAGLTRRKYFQNCRKQVGLSRATLESQVSVFILVILDSKYTFAIVKELTWSLIQLYKKLVCVLTWPEVKIKYCSVLNPIVSRLVKINWPEIAPLSVQYAQVKLSKLNLTSTLVKSPPPFTKRIQILYTTSPNKTKNNPT